MLDERLLDVALAVRGAGLAQVLRVGTQDVRLPPVEVGLHDQGVEAVLLDLGAPQQPDRLDDVGGALLVELDARGEPQAEVVDPHLVAVGQVELVRALVEDLDAHLGEDRQRPGQRHRLPGTEHLEAPVGVVVRIAGVEGEREPVVVGQVVQQAEVAHADTGREVLLVRLGERVLVAAEEPFAVLLAASLDDQVVQVVAPAADRRRHLGLDRVAIGAGRLGARADGDEELHPREVELDQAVVAADDLAGPVLGDDGLDALARLRPEPVGRDVDQHGDEVTVEVDAGEDADRPALEAVRHELGETQQVARRRFEQLVARQRPQRCEQLAAGVAVRAHSGAQHDLGDAPAHDGYAADGAVLGIGDQTEEDVHHLRRARREHGDAVVARRAAHGRHDRGLEDHQRGAAAEGRQQLERRDAAPRRAARPRRPRPAARASGLASSLAEYAAWPRIM